MNLLSLLFPLAYLTVLIGSLATFSSLYRRRQAAKQASLEPWFPTHLQRNIYLSLLELQQNPTATSTTGTTTNEKDALVAASSTKIPDSILKAALFRRAVEDIHRLIQLRSQKPALAQLLARGSVGDELMQRLQMAEKEMEHEIKDVVAEANALAPQQQWGNTIFQSASESAHREGVIKRLKIVEERRSKVKREWDARRDSVKADFMKELDGQTGKGTASSTTAEKDGARKTGSSDEDAPVIVDSADASVPEQDVASNAGGSIRKKKKGKN